MRGRPRELKSLKKTSCFLLTLCRFGLRRLAERLPGRDAEPGHIGTDVLATPVCMTALRQPGRAQHF